MITYYFQWGKGSFPVSVYAYPLTLIGTVGLVVGMYLCAYIIEASTVELRWRISKGVGQENIQGDNQESQRIIWVQKMQNVADQEFKPFAIYAPLKNTHLSTSHGHHDRARFHSRALGASVISVVGMMPFLLLEST